MSHRTINIKLGKSGIGKTDSDIARITEAVEEGAKAGLKQLASMALEEADTRYRNAVYDVNAKDGTYLPNDARAIFGNESDYSYEILADGDDAPFIEFGAGVYFNKVGQYPAHRPDGIDEIGEYGFGNGKRKAWGFGPKGDVYITRGTPMQMPLVHARNKVLNMASKVIRGQINARL